MAKIKLPARMPGVGGYASGSTRRRFNVRPAGVDAKIWTTTRSPGSASRVSVPVVTTCTSVTGAGDGDGDTDAVWPVDDGEAPALVEAGPMGKPLSATSAVSASP